MRLFNDAIMFNINNGKLYYVGHTGYISQEEVIFLTCHLEIVAKIMVQLCLSLTI